MTAYYNENDPKAAATLRELIANGLIAPGEVDERSIEDVKPTELLGFTQCHFFAGFGIWSLAFRLAGWPDHRPVWSGSCPCQPFSAAGKGVGFADERHLWPAFFHLIQHGKPEGVPVFGEQVASPDGLTWLDLVQADMEAAGHTVWPFDICAAGFGAPIIRQRLFWLACATRGRLGSRLRDSGQAGIGRSFAADGCSDGFVGSPTSGGLAVRGGASGESGRPSLAGVAVRMESSGGIGFQSRSTSQPGQESGEPLAKHGSEPSGMGGSFQSRLEGVSIDPGPTNGFWRDVDWLYCRDGKWRPVEGGTFPLAHGDPERVGRLRGYGNAINSQTAAAFIASAMEVMQ